MTDELLGRDVELRQIADVLDRARGGHGGLLLVRGDAGIGKTRMLDEVVALASRRGFRILVGRADEFDQRVPFAALRLSLGPALRAERSPRLVEDARRLDAALGLAALPDDDSGSPQVFELLHRVFTGWASIGPVLLAVDDFHTADADTVAAFGFLTRHLRDRIVVAAATRSHPPDLGVEMATMVDRLVASGPSCVVDLAPLELGDTAALVAASLGATPSAGVAQKVWSSTQGNPFFTVELLRALDELGMVWVDDGEVRLAGDAPMAVSAGSTVLHRVFNLGPAARQVAQVSAVLPEVRLDDLGWIEETTGLPAAAVDAGFDTLVRANLLQRAGPVYRFTHPIVRTTIYEDLGPAQRRRLHASIAALRYRQRDAGLPVEVVDIARHLRLAASPGDVDAARVFIEAGDVSLGQAPRSAAAWYEDALRVMPLAAADRGAVLWRLARAHYLASHKPKAATVAREALALLPDGPLHAAAVELCVVALQTSGQFAEALALFDEFSGDPAPLSPRLVGHRAQLLLWLDRIAEAQTELDRAQALADSDGDHVIDATRLFMLWTTGQPAAARALAADMWSKLPRYSSIRRHGTLAVLASAAAYNGEPRAVVAAMAELGEPALLPGLVRTAVVYERMLSGRWDEALQLAATMEPELEDGDRALLPLLLSAVAHMRAERGELLDVDTLRSRLLSFPIFQTGVLAAVGHIDIAVGDLDSARALLRQAHDRELHVGRYGTLGPKVLLLVDVELATGREDAAKQLAATLDEHIGDESGAQSRACHHLVRALVHHDAGEAAAAATVAADNGLAFEHARASYVLGKLTDDAEPLVAAAATFGGLRARVRERDAVRELRRLGRRMPRSARAGGVLSDTERQLAHLVGQGLTNRQIAEAVHLSPKTIEHYLSRLYSKVGVSSRVDLAVAISSGQLEI